MKLVIMHDGEESEVLDSETMKSLDLTKPKDVETLRFNVKYVVDNLLAYEAVTNAPQEDPEAFK